MGAMKKLYGEVQELADQILMDLDLDIDSNLVYRDKMEDRLLRWVERTFLQTGFPTETQYKALEVLLGKFDRLEIWEKPNGGYEILCYPGLDNAYYYMPGGRGSTLRAAASEAFENAQRKGYINDGT